eukprot:11169541-Lingulodinium_polyedra.AAC.1
MDCAAANVAARSASTVGMQASSCTATTVAAVAGGRGKPSATWAARQTPPALQVLTTRLANSAAAGWGPSEGRWRQ